MMLNGVKQMPKKKNTYSIKFSHLINYEDFLYCLNTPLVVITKNGHPIKQTGWDTAQSFPNPGAVRMGVNFELLRSVMGKKMATTIIEYLDKETNKPVVTLFPTYIHIHPEYTNGYLKHLNHASRKDLNYQIQLRFKALQK